MSTHERDLYELARDFFRFPDNAPIKIVLPTVQRQRPSSLTCHNYPLFNCELSPDDVLSAMRIYSLLVVSYRTHVEVQFPDLFTPPNAVFIGGPPTNEFVAEITKTFPIHFDPDNTNRVLHGTQQDYEIGFSAREGEERSVTEDYCLLSKCTDGQGVKFFVGGLRAYGQLVSYWFLSNPDFYHQISDVSRSSAFQILVRVPVRGRTCGNWEIVEKLDTLQPRKVFIAHVSEDLKTVERLRADLERRSIDVLQYKVSIKLSDDWVREIEGMIQECDYFIACFSKDAAAKDSIHLKKELENMCKEDWGRQHQMPGDNWIIPLRLDECQIPELPIGDNRNLKRIQWIDLFGPDRWEGGLQEIIRTIWEPKRVEGRREREA